MEAWPRLYIWPPELWREATVFNRQFIAFAIVVPVGLAASLRRDRPRFGLAITGSVLFALALLIWLLWVASANAILATWEPGPIPEDFHDVRSQWESGHMVITALKMLGFLAISLAVAMHREQP